ncbi:GrpB family protein [Actinopolymorpha pittospori]|uniref:GrpB-like predicted nucleotidyltransferase (UPF0157 family) n=1 Tax=Actinopolymorpha pittospori TaxID=648752 RepID=A0A927MQ30_9ACTN|nr:GrpB family protein [Actinopolymorpha pittospori]MBE1604286.1 GrpB-like predicted nucleotidyltransferase (UPF0157 family) [Actinopolymorpha pittospori]
MSETSVHIVEYDPAWPTLAGDAVAELRATLPQEIVEIEHIGSTAVPGLAAKPVIDLMAATPDLETVSRREDALQDLGYRPHTNGMVDRLLYFRTAGGVRTHILHVVTLASWPTRNQRIFRDYLRNHPLDAQRYGQLKRAIATAGTPGDDYTKAKTALIQEIVDRARTELGLLPEPVWEKPASTGS